MLNLSQKNTIRGTENPKNIGVDSKNLLITGFIRQLKLQQYIINALIQLIDKYSDYSEYPYVFKYSSSELFLAKHGYLYVYDIQKENLQEKMSSINGVIDVFPMRSNFYYIKTKNSFYLMGRISSNFKNTEDRSSWRSSGDHYAYQLSEPIEIQFPRSLGEVENVETNNDHSNPLHWLYHKSGAVTVILYDHQSVRKKEQANTDASNPIRVNYYRNYITSEDDSKIVDFYASFELPGCIYLTEKGNIYFAKHKEKSEINNNMTFSYRRRAAYSRQRFSPFQEKFFHSAFRYEREGIFSKFSLIASDVQFFRISRDSRCVLVSCKGGTEMIAIGRGAKSISDNLNKKRTGLLIKGFTRKLGLSYDTIDLLIEKYLPGYNSSSNIFNIELPKNKILRSIKPYYDSFYLFMEDKQTTMVSLHHLSNNECFTDVGIQLNQDDPFWVRYSASTFYTLHHIKSASSNKKNKEEDDDCILVSKGYHKILGEENRFNELIPTKPFIKWKDFCGSLRPALGYPKHLSHFIWTRTKLFATGLQQNDSNELILTEIKLPSPMKPRDIKSLVLVKDHYVLFDRYGTLFSTPNNIDIDKDINSEVKRIFSNLSMA